MHPESDIAREFWIYLSYRTHGGVNREEYPWPDLVVRNYISMDWAHRDLGLADDEDLPWEEAHSRREGLPPCAFPRLQDALYDFLLAHIGSDEIAGDYELWLRGVAQIMADIVHDPKRLTLQVARVRRDFAPPDHTMTLADDWSVLLPQTFQYVWRQWQTAEDLRAKHPTSESRDV